MQSAIGWLQLPRGNIILVLAVATETITRSLVPGYTGSKSPESYDRVRRARPYQSDKRMGSRILPEARLDNRDDSEGAILSDDGDGPSGVWMTGGNGLERANEEAKGKDGE